MDSVDPAGLNSRGDYAKTPVREYFDLPHSVMVCLGRNGGGLIEPAGAKDNDDRGAS